MTTVQLQMFLLCVSYLEKLFKSFFIYFNSCNCLLNLTQDHIEMLIKGLKMPINTFFKKRSKWFTDADKLMGVTQGVLSCNSEGEQKDLFLGLKFEIWGLFGLVI